MVVGGCLTILTGAVVGTPLAEAQPDEASAHATTFEVTVENVSTPGLVDTERAMGTVPMSPGAFAVFEGETNPVFTPGETASPGVELIAEDGFPMTLAEALAADAAAAASGTFETADGPLAPAFAAGTSGTFTFSATPGQKLSFVNMFVQSNDFFFADDGEGIELFDGDTPISGDITDQVALWDAGTEEDTAPGTGDFQKPVQDPDATDVGPAENDVIKLVADTDDGFDVPANSSVIKLTITAVEEPTEFDLTTGAVFAMSNARGGDGGNTVVAYARNSDGTLTEAGRFPTEGAGSGSFEDTANGLVLGTSEGEAAPNNLIELADGGQQLLLATNAGSNTISVFQVHPDGLQLVDVEDSRGEKPVSVTVNGGLVYVLNSGETNDDLFDADGNVIDNCTTGDKPELSGFTITPDGDLSPISGSTRRLSNEAVSGCAQVSFNPSGNVITVTERLSQPSRLDQQQSSEERLDDEGVIDTFVVQNTGRLTRRQIIDATGQGPFGFTFMKNGNLLTTEQSDGPGGVGRGTAASYVIDENNPARPTVLASSPSVQNHGTDTCWFVATDSQTIGFATSFFGEGRISSYELDDLGIVRLIEDVATGADSMNDHVAMGASDISLSGNSEYLYQLNSINGTINVFANNGDGTLTFVEQQTPFPQPPFGPGMGMAAPVGLAAN